MQMVRREALYRVGGAVIWAAGRRSFLLVEVVESQ